MRIINRRAPVYTVTASLASVIALVWILATSDDAPAPPSVFLCAFSATMSLSGTIAVLRSRSSAPRAAPRPPLGAAIDLEHAGLSPREREFVHLLLGGLSMKEIAYERNLSPSTVRYIFSEVYRQLGVADQKELFLLGAYYKLE
jgi:Response regulator containing a CheY-like receiver domain and an HTH DNA-binding domain